MKAASFKSVRRILSSPALPADWWRVVSLSAYSGAPHHESLLDLYIDELIRTDPEVFGLTREDMEPGIPPLPASLDALDASLPSISREEAFALLSRFLLAERGALIDGVAIQPLHWLVLCGLYCPGRERWSVLQDLCNAGYLTAAAKTTLYVPSALGWPMVITSRAIEEIEDTVRVRVFLPTFTAIAEWLGPWMRRFPFIRSFKSLLSG